MNHNKNTQNMGDTLHPDDDRDEKHLGRRVRSIPNGRFTSASTGRMSGIFDTEYRRELTVEELLDELSNFGN